MHRILIDWILNVMLVAFFLLILSLAGCAASKDDVLPAGKQTMRDVWNRETAAGAVDGSGLAGQRLLDARLALRRPLAGDEAQAAGSAAYTRTAATEIASQFRRLPNPDMLVYVFPHLAGSDPVPVPGYSTVFPLYRRVPYAMPGERLENP